MTAANDLTLAEQETLRVLAEEVLTVATLVRAALDDPTRARLEAAVLHVSAVVARSAAHGQCLFGELQACAKRSYTPEELETLCARLRQLGELYPTEQVNRADLVKWLRADEEKLRALQERQDAHPRELLFLRATCDQFQAEIDWMDVSGPALGDLFYRSEAEGAARLGAADREGQCGRRSGAALCAALGLQESEGAIPTLLWPALCNKLLRAYDSAYDKDDKE